MKSLILRTATMLLVPLMVMFSLFLLLRGHDEPGGGFVGGLVVSCAFGLYTVGYGPDNALAALRVHPRFLIGWGLLLALLAALLPMFLGLPVLTGLWYFHPDSDFKVGSSLLFDLGVYLVVMGATLTILLGLEQERERRRN